MTAYVLLAVAVALRAATVLMAVYFLRDVKHRLVWLLLVGSLAVTTLDLELRLQGHEGTGLTVPSRLQEAIVPLVSSLLLLFATILGGRLIRRESKLSGFDTRYRLLFENLPTAFAYHRVITDASGQPVDYVFLEVNQAFEKQTGLRREDIIGHRVTEVLPGIRESARDWIGEYGRIALQGGVLGFEDYSEGLDRWYSVSAYSPEPGHFVTVFLDITESKQAAEKLQHTEEQLRQAQKMEAVGRLAGGVAHDFNNLLTVIMGHSGVLRKQLGEDHPLLDQVREIRDASERAASLTRQLLTFSRKQVVAPVNLNMNRLLQGTEKMLRRLIGENIAIDLRLDSELGTIHADPGQLEQVIMNLVVNARDAMPDGGTLSIETANVEVDATFADSHLNCTPGPYVRVAVSDTGIGMDAETQVRIFEPFFTTKGPDRGTGLGLSIVYGIIKQAGGSIWVYSEPGHGTTFKIYLPRVNAEALARLDPDETRNQVGGDETVLLAEDETPVRRIVATILSRAGYHVIEAESAEQALLAEEAYPGPIHLLITDAIMSGMNGRELAEQISVRRPDTPVLFMSGYTSDTNIQQRILESGAAYLQKPFTVEDVLTKVREVLGRTPVSGQS